MADIIEPFEIEANIEEDAINIHVNFVDPSYGMLDKNYVHEQAEPSEEWHIHHGLNKFCSVTVVDSANTTVIGDVEYVDINNIILRFGSAFAGKAYLN